MTNSKTSKTGGSCKDGVHVNNNSLGAGENDGPTVDSRQWMNYSDNECLAGINVAQYGSMEEGTDEDADEVNNDGDTSTSFSLQECMNEFRARRIRRSSLSQHRQDVGKVSGVNRKNFQETTELDLINQNRCNKEQERQCKPCQNGFCYCFTSDSGDGGGNIGGCYKSRSLQARNSRRNRQSECVQVSKQTSKGSISNDRAKVYNSQAGKSLETKATLLKNTAEAPNKIKAISSLETSSRDAPLIHIVQELRKNCVISKVKVNKHKMQPFENGTNLSQKSLQIITQKKTHFKEPEKIDKVNNNVQKPFHRLALDKNEPSAPTLENFFQTSKTTNNVSLSSEKNKKCTECSQRHCKPGGKLLLKRLSHSQLNYKPRNINNAPPKPPRISLNCENQYGGSFTSTSSSVRKAEEVVDNFLTKKGVNLTTTINETKLMKNSEKSNITKNVEIDKRQPGLLTPTVIKNQTENIHLTYPSLSDFERVLESKKSPTYNKNIRSATDNVKKVMSIGWNETNIKDMLNYDVNTKERKYHSSFVKAQPQEIPSIDVAGIDKPIGWKQPPLIHLDTVDGGVHHNLASNLEKKNTPVKTKLVSPSNKIKGGSRTQKFPWSEQLRHLSPWSNKQSINDINYSKRNLRSSSKAFIKSSKKKFLRLVSPKKENKERKSVQIRKTPYRTVGIQTSCNDVSQCQTDIRNQYEHSSSSQSPPGSYHSPIQSSHIQYPSSTQSQNTTPNSKDSALSRFDFSRTVHSPSKKVPRSSQRKLNFPIKCSLACNEDASDNTSSKDAMKKKTYRSFNSELDHDISMSNISCILSNIRAKLEASDDNAVRTFLESESFNGHRKSGFIYTDSNCNIRIDEKADMAKHLETSKIIEEHMNDPIYSEIEDDSVHIFENPAFGNHTGIQHLVAVNNPEILYAKVNKSNKSILNKNDLQFKQQKLQIPLAKIMQDSLKNKKIINNINPLPTLSEPPGSESGTYSSPISLTLPLSHSQSLNNVRVMEHNLTPKKQRNLSKSDLSLHRSEIFLENLCKSELFVNASLEQENLEKVENGKNIPNRLYMSMPRSYLDDLIGRTADCDVDTVSNDTVSYELPNDEDEIDNIGGFFDEEISTTAGSNMGLNKIAPPSSNNQSTPKKQSFVTKDGSNTNVLRGKVETINIDDNLYNRTTLQKHSDVDIVDQKNPLKLHSLSENEVFKHEAKKYSNVKTVCVIEKYNSFKNVLYKSFRKSKRFIKAEGTRLSTSLNFPVSNASVSPTLSSGKPTCADSNLNLETLLSLNESATVNEQIAHTVSICRKLPDLEISMEMVEAERLLLFSTLRRGKKPPTTALLELNHTLSKKPKLCFFIDDMFLPVFADINQDVFFNYFYIITFECGGVIKSTQSAECVNGTAVFRDCGIEFVLYSEIDTNLTEKTNRNAVKCSIFLLRLRKISTASTESKNRLMTPSTSPLSSSSSTSSFNEVVSRFRLQSSFTLDATNFVPFEYVHKESNNCDRICIRASCFCTLPLTARTKSTNLSGQLHLKGRAEVRFPKVVFAGFLNVEDPNSQHNWNRRWCTLDGIFLYVWQDENSLNISPLITLDLRDTKRNNCPLSCSSKESCARTRSFCLNCIISKQGEDKSTATVFFSAETQKNLEEWLKNLNIVLDFIATWF